MESENKNPKSADEQKKPESQGGEKTAPAENVPSGTKEEKPAQGQAQEGAETQTPAAPAQKGAEKPKEAPPQKPPRPKECAVCNKSIKNFWYYREGGYYCSKGCWKKSKKKKLEDESSEKAGSQEKANSENKK